MMKRILALSLSLIMLLAFAGCTKKSDKPIETSPGKIVSVPVYMANNPGFVAATMEISYDNSAFSFVSAEKSKSFSNTTVSDKGSSVSFVAVDENAFVEYKNNTSTDALITLKFKVKDSAEKKQYSFDTVSYQFINLDEQEVKVVSKIPAVIVK